MSIGEKIKNVRLKNKLSQDTFSEKLYITRQTLSNWENNKSLPDILSIIKISELFNISIDELLKGEKDIINNIERDAKKLDMYKKYYLYAFVLYFLGMIFNNIDKMIFVSNNFRNLFQLFSAGFVLSATIIIAVPIIKTNYLKENEIESTLKETDLFYWFITNEKIPIKIRYVTIIVFYLLLALLFFIISFEMNNEIGQILCFLTIAFIIICGLILIKKIQKNNKK